MAFIETPRFFDGFALGSSGGPGYNTSVVENIGGSEYRVQRQSLPKHRYDVGAGIDTPAKLDEVRTQFHACKGRLTGFRIKDFNDWKSTTNMVDTISDTDQLIGTGDASEVDFQLVKNYTVTNETIARKITKPVSGTVVISLNDVSQPSGWSVDTKTGIVTFSSPPGGSVSVKAGFEFDVPVRFDADQLMVQKLDYLNELATLGLVEDLNA